MPAGDVFGLDGIFLNKSNPITVSSVEINQTTSGAGIAITAGTLDTTAGTATLTLSNATGLSTTPFYTGAKIAVSGLSDSTGVAHTGYNGVFVVTGFAGTTTVSYATTGYVGIVTTGITTTGLAMLVTDTAVTNTTWSSAQTHGWFGGGFAPAVVDRIDFSNDTGTASSKSSLSAIRNNLAATGNSNYGWFGMGSPTIFPGAAVSSVDRIDFSNDSPTASTRGSLSKGRTSLAATGNSNYGWFGGGFDGITYTSLVDRIDFSNDSGTASPRGPLSQGRTSSAATGNSNYGWFGGGLIIGPPATAVSTIDRIDFSNDNTTASARGPVYTPFGFGIRFMAATGNSNYGWFGGGMLPGAPTTTYSTINRVDFANDSVSTTTRGPLSSARYAGAATGNSNYGWFGGGSVPATISSTNRIDFSNDSVTASPRGPLSSARYGIAATSGQARSSSTRLQKAGSYGWFGGGITVPAPINYTSTVDRIDFSNDTPTATPRSPLSLARGFMGATQNSNYGWFGGGFNGGVPASYSRVDRIDFSNDNTTASIRGPLTLARYHIAATGNSNYGWFGGGLMIGPALTSRVDRIDFSNDSVTASTKTSLNAPAGRSNVSATGNSNYGWFGGGAPGPLSTVDRIDFSNDSSTASTRSPLSASRYSPAATGNSNYGWWGGGASPTFISTVDRIDFSNDSVGALVRGPLTRTRSRPGATGNSNYGWWGGGSAAPPVSSVDRINFSNDSVVASLRGPFSASPGRDGPGATSNTTR